MENLNTDKAARMCPECLADSLVYDSRVQPDGSILRRRRCPMCGTKFETVEHFSRLMNGSKPKRKKNKT